MPARALIFLGGAYADSALCRSLLRSMEEPEAADEAPLILAADGGAERALSFGLRPDRVLGDLDSLSARALARLRAARVPVEIYPERKNMTDGELALDCARRAGIRQLLIFSGLGAKRPDHVLGNYFLLLEAARAGLEARLTDGRSLLLPLRGPGTARLRFRDELGYRPQLSVLPLFSDLRGLRYAGLAYDLEAGAALRAGSGRGLSNYPAFFDRCSRARFISERPEWEISLALEAGEGLLVLCPEDAGKLEKAE